MSAAYLTCPCGKSFYLSGPDNHWLTIAVETFDELHAAHRHPSTYLPEGAAGA